MADCTCTMQTEIATLTLEVANLKTGQTETRDLVIVVTKVVEQLSTVQKSLGTMEKDIQIIKDKPMSAISKALWMIAGVVISIVVNRIMVAI